MTVQNNKSVVDNQDQEFEQQNQDNNQDDSSNESESTGIKNLREAHNRQKEENKRLQEKLAAIEAEKAEKENKELEEQGKFKELLTKAESRIAELEGEMTRTQRLSSVESELRKAGASDEVIDLLSDNILKTHDWDSDETTVEKTIEKLKESRPSLFTTVKSGTSGVGKTAEPKTEIDALKSSNSDEDLRKLRQLTK